MPKQRPLIETTIRTEFGDVLDDASFYDVSGSDRDLTYVPGFSDMRRARDLELAQVASGKLPAHKAKREPLPVNLRWARATDTKGSPDSRKLVAAGNMGYKLVNQSDVKQHAWLRDVPPGSDIGVDGSIRKGDTVLMVADGKTAARNAARKAAQTARMQRDTAAAAGGLLDVGSRKQGVEPYVKTEN